MFPTIEVDEFFLVKDILRAPEHTKFWTLVIEDIYE